MPVWRVILGDVSGRNQPDVVTLGRLPEANRRQQLWTDTANSSSGAVAGGLQSADADDVTRAILLKMVRALPTFRYDGNLSFRGWLKTITHNCWHDRLSPDGYRRRRQRIDAAWVPFPA